MIDKPAHVAWAAEAVAVFQKHCGTSDVHAIADFICDLEHLADARGSDFLDEVKRGSPGTPSIMLLIATVSRPDAAVEITYAEVISHPGDDAGKLSRSLARVVLPNLGLVVQDHVQERVTDFQFSVVFDVA
jgi:hypothetical protein